MKENIIKKLFSLGNLRNFKEGELIFKEGDISREFCYVMKGKVSVEKMIDPSGTIRILTISQGEFFGEMVLFIKGRRLAQVRAIEETKILFLERDRFLNFLKNNSKEGIEIFLFVTEKILQRIKHTNRELSCFYQLATLSSRLEDIREFLEAVARIIYQTFYFSGVSVYFFNQVLGEYELVYQRYLEDKKIAKLSPFFSQFTLLDKKKLISYGIKETNFLLTFPLKVRKVNIGTIIFSKKKKFTDNELAFLRVISSQVESFLEDFFARQEVAGKERLKYKYFRF